MDEALKDLAEHVEAAIGEKITTEPAVSELGVPGGAGVGA